MRLIQPGNSKLHNTFMFNIPATKPVCNRICKGCYAAREQVRFPAVLAAREKRLEASKQATFPSTICGEISRLRNKPKYFRLHASGEFYSQAYVNFWTMIAKANPDIMFYTYTKRLNDFDFSNLSSLDNFVLINSLHFGKLNYGPIADAPANAFVCPHSDTVRCGVECTYCMGKEAQTNGVYFKKH